MEKPEISIIIPTYDRKDVLIETLSAINNQSYNLGSVEVIVYDDHSPVSPKKEILALETKYELRYFRGDNNIGQGQVRNKAIKLAKAEYLFFIGDDTVPQNNFIEEHMNLHKLHNGIAVLGRVLWSPELRNDFMNYIEKIQFHYQTIKDRNNVKLHFYTSNISLEKRWFNNEEYSSKFRNYGLEDLELGYRLERNGLRVVYNPEAIVYHFHTYTFEQFCNRMKNVGISAVIFANLHPELKRKYIPPFRNFIKMGSFILSNKFTEKINKRIYWFSNFVYSYLSGIDEELKK